MRVLLDTHALIWFVSGDKQFSENARRAIELHANEVLVSTASIWEMAIKISLGKLRLRLALDDQLLGFLEENGFDILRIEYAHAAHVASLPFAHKDPFDRVLAAQTIIERITIISHDEIFDRYGADRLW